MVEAEAVRLVIWDLDETFWAGTVTEGGHIYNQTAHDTVISLAKRGILSSICSKNDRATVEDILRAEGIWDYFIFPSIDWSSKGSRIKGILDAVKLRAASVVFIDDNPQNLAEAQHFCPGLQVSDEKIVPILLNDPRFSGKDDEALSRLAQYKVLEQKHRDVSRADGDVHGFLRNSGIRVFIQHDVENNIDRAVELINRTNQLNFTKVRLSEDADAARAELLAQLKGFSVNAGLVYAIDRYGDYGCIGFYLMQREGHSGRRLVHYCFSCRTLGMEIETWLFNRLNRPKITIIGEVLTDIHRQVQEVDWISEVTSRAALGRDVAPPSMATLVVRGGCDVRAILHYIEGLFERTFEELNDVVYGMSVRTDHSIFLKYALEGLSQTSIASVGKLGFSSAHFTSAITNLNRDQPNVILLSFWLDAGIHMYRHRETGVRVPVLLPGFGHNLLGRSHEQLEGRLTDKFALQAAAYLREKFEFAGPIKLDEYAAIIDQLIALTPSRTLLLFIQPPSYWYQDNTNEIMKMWKHKMFGDINAERAAGRPNVAVIDPHDFAGGREDYGEWFHFTRPVYQRIGQAALQAIEAFSSGLARDAAAEPAAEILTS